MRFTLSSFLLLPSLTLAVPVSSSPRQLLPTGYDVKQDVINIHNAVLALDKTVQVFNGGPFLTALVEGAPVLAGVADIHRVNRAGFRHALAALPFSIQETNDVINTVVATVNTSIPTATTHLKIKEPMFRESGLSAVVIASLTLLLYDHDTFSAVVLAKSNLGIEAAKIKEGNDAVANIHNAIKDAITFYTVSAIV